MITLFFLCQPFLPFKVLNHLNGPVQSTSCNTHSLQVTTTFSLAATLVLLGAESLSFDPFGFFSHGSGNNHMYG